MTDKPDLSETSTTETTIRHLDTDGRVISETTTVVTRRESQSEDLPTGMYL